MSEAKLELNEYTIYRTTRESAYYKKGALLRLYHNDESSCPWFKEIGQTSEFHCATLDDLEIAKTETRATVKIGGKEYYEDELSEALSKIKAIA